MACHCMGPQNGEPECPCRMAAIRAKQAPDIIPFSRPDLLSRFDRQMLGDLTTAMNRLAEAFERLPPVAPKPKEPV